MNKIEIIEPKKSSKDDNEKSLSTPNTWSEKDDSQLDYLHKVALNMKFNKGEKDRFEALLEAGGPMVKDFLIKFKLKKLANKVLKCTDLIKEDKEAIYKKLTDEEPPPGTKRGAPSLVSRDTLLALEYMIRIYKGAERKIVRRELQIKYQIRENHTFDLALKRGKDYLRSFAHEIYASSKVLHQTKQKESPIDSAIKRLISKFIGKDHILYLLDMANKFND